MLRELWEHLSQRLDSLAKDVSSMGAVHGDLGRQLLLLDGRVQRLAEAQSQTRDGIDGLISHQSCRREPEQLAERLVKVERQQKTLIVSAQRALEIALDAKQRQQELSRSLLPLMEKLSSEPSDSRTTATFDTSVSLLSTGNGSGIMASSGSTSGSCSYEGKTTAAGQPCIRDDAWAEAVQSLDIRLQKSVRQVEERLEQLRLSAAEACDLSSLRVQVHDALGQIAIVTERCNQLETGDDELAAKVADIDSQLQVHAGHLRALPKDEALRSAADCDEVLRRSVSPLGLTNESTVMPVRSTASAVAAKVDMHVLEISNICKKLRMNAGQDV
eukprot:TRINITY_DN19639_c0_g1_i3.p1 TRINITY_DN19639_c0_g1~~TRINITY_DN19639_c0_g1_i3.p1  ORF type:complete len:387 (-),score=71.59 TRINITY_DN19639_c0_g1_i3:32-1021(-)